MQNYQALPALCQSEDCAGLRIRWIRTVEVVKDDSVVILVGSDRLQSPRVLLGRIERLPYPQRLRQTVFLEIRVHRLQLRCSFF